MVFEFHIFTVLSQECSAILFDGSFIVYFISSVIVLARVETDQKLKSRNTIGYNKLLL